jgi:hypothetical protein
VTYVTAARVYSNNRKVSRHMVNDGSSPWSICPDKHKTTRASRAGLNSVGDNVKEYIVHTYVLY